MPVSGTGKSTRSTSHGWSGWSALAMPLATGFTLVLVAINWSIHQQSVHLSHEIAAYHIAPSHGGDDALPIGPKLRRLVRTPAVSHAPRGACPEKVTPFSVDCHILQAERADPFVIRRQWKEGRLPVINETDCSEDKLSSLDRDSRKMLDNIHLPPRGAVELTEKQPGMRILCMLLTYSKKHDTNLRAVRATWGKRCHGLVAFSDMADLSIPSIRTPVYGGERYENTWQKMRAFWKYTWYHYSNSFDWFLKADDDTFVIWENLVEFLAQGTIQDARESGEGVYLGRQLWEQGRDDRLYVSGGAGYILDGAALGKLVNNLDAPACDPDGQHRWEDLYAGLCLANAGVIPMDTRDELHRERFNPFQTFNHYRYKGGDWLEKYSKGGVQVGVKSASRRAISFHSMTEHDTIHAHRYLYHCRKTITFI